MNLDDKYKILELHEEESVTSITNFISVIKKQIEGIVSSVKDLEVTKETLKVGKTVNIVYKNKYKDEKGSSSVSFEIVVSGFGKNGRTNKNEGVTVNFEFLEKDGKVKSLPKKKGSPDKMIEYIKKYFKDNLDIITKFDDKTGSNDFIDAKEDGSGTGTGDIAVHATPLGSDKNGKRKKKLSSREILS